MAEQQEEGLLEKIYALVAPPQTATTGKQKGKKSKAVSAAASQAKHSGIENNPFCNACGDGGSLLCCDNCPASFHFYCCDPPVDPKDLPSGEWLCRSCSSVPPPHSTPPLFKPLLQQATSANPLIFNIAEELKSTELLPGQSKRRGPGPRSITGKGEEKDHGPKLCFACNKRVHSTQLAQCDFCPLHFHLSCVDPPLTTPPATAWMCPLHPHHSIPDFEHPRLSRRLRALEKGREEVKSTKVKLDFLSKVSRIPHYKRVTRHLKRRVSQVPPAVKALYSDPLPDACETPPLTESLVSAAEVCQWWRGEEERRRREFAAISSSSSSSFLPPSDHVDKWTRDAVIHQVNRHQLDTPPSPTSPPHHHHSNKGLHDDTTVFIAATQLLELSRRNGVLKPRDLREPGHLKRNSMTNVSCKDEVEMKGAVNGVGEEVKEDIHEGEGGGGGEGSGEGGKVEECRQREGEEKTQSEGGEGREEEKMVCGQNGEAEGGNGEGEEEKEEETEMEVPEEKEDVHNDLLCAPDTSQLDPRLVQLLASQRLQQLFHSSHDDETRTTGSPPLKSNHPLGKGVNGIHSVVFPPPAKPTPTPDDLRSAQSVLCPVSGVGTAFAVHKHVTLIGTGSGVDVSLSRYGHCNYLSPRHACIFYNKVTGEYELLNYSDHGSGVDGVLYSCDFSDKTSVEVKQTSSATGLSPDKAREKVESARRNLRDQAEAKRALEGALSLSRHLGKEEGGGEGSRRTTYNSSVVSIPLVLSRAKKLSAGVPAGSKTPGKTEPVPEKPTPHPSSISLLCPDPPPNPCLCRHSASCLVGTNRKGWEGTATLYHGSRLRFGCLQFVFSVAGRPGHSELLDSLSPLLHVPRPAY